jgi:Zn-finger nucleic acid-binding protein
MFCPGDNSPMHQVQIEGHYGEPIFLDQCEKCGGIWFDQSELFRARQGQSGKIDMVDTNNLWAPSEIVNTQMLCPRDCSVLVPIIDKYLPPEIHLERCPVCNGFWLNRGEFSKYQQTRKRLPANTEFEEQMKQILSAQPVEGEGVLAKVGRYLTTPLDETTLKPLDTVEMSPEMDRKIGIILNVLSFLFKAFVSRYFL